MALSGDFTAIADYPLPLPTKSTPGKFTVDPSSKHPIMLTLPVQKVQTSTGVNPDCPAISAFDQRGETCFATARAPKNGDLVAVILSKPLTGISDLSLNLGDPQIDKANDNDEEDSLPGTAILEISTDGTTFEAAGELTESYQVISLKDKAIIAFRIRFTSDWTEPFRLAEVEPLMNGGDEGEADDEGEDPNGDDEAEDMNAGDGQVNDDADADEDDE
jgi:hypothetical protein